MHYNPYVHNYANDYLTFVAKENGTFRFTPITSRNDNIISYSTDDGSTWIEGNSVEVNSGDKVMWKGTMTPASLSWTSHPIAGIGRFSTTNNFDVQGNAMSLLYGDDFKGQTSLSGKSYAFAYLFENTKVVNAENLSLPATKLAMYCYGYMFHSCTSLVTAPELPATTSEVECYQYMFNGCTSLTSAPELYATTLNVSCYRYMFYGCTNLSSITCLATNISASDCTSGWVDGVAASGTFTKAASMSSWATGNNGIPNGWTVQDYQ